MRHKVSIIITAYNVEQYIAKAIESAISQTYDNIEVLVVEDCSTDNTLSIIKEFSEIVLIQNNENVGAGKSRGVGIEKSTGEYILFLDGDDYLEPECIEKLIEESVKQNADLVRGKVRTIEANGQIIDEAFTSKVFLGLDKFSYSRIGHPFLNPYLIRKRLFDKVEYCPRRFIEDTPTLYKLLYFANKVVFVDCIVYNYVQRSSSLCHTSNGTKHSIFTALTLIDAIKFFREHNEHKIIEMLDLYNGLQSIILCCYMNNNLDHTLPLYDKELQYILTEYNKLVDYGL